MKRSKFYYLFHPCVAWKAILTRISDRYAIEQQWKLHMDYPLDLDNPKTLNEKLQWLKLHDHKAIYHKMSDKYEMKQVIKDTWGVEYAIPTIALYEHVSEIDWDQLPNQFVIKCTHDSGSLIICRDKETFNTAEAEEKLSKKLRQNFYRTNQEWAYKTIKPRIIVEPLLCNKDGSELVDYKFYSYGGKLCYFMVSYGETRHLGKNLKFSPSCECIDYLFKKEPTMPLSDVRLPSNINKMIQMAEEFCKDFPHIRIDMYNVDGHIYVGEFTFYTNGGYISMCNEEYSKSLADLIDISKISQ